MNHQLDARTGIREALPTVFGYIGIGIAFGIVGQAAGFSPLIVSAMSFFIFAGSAQFVTVSMLTGGSPILSIVLATFLVNARMILMGMTIAPYFKAESLGKNLWLGTLLTDESFALGMNKLNHTKGRLSFEWFNAANLISYATWVFSTIIGAYLGRFIANPQALGLEFAVVAMFIGLLYLQIISDRSMIIALQLIMVLITFGLMSIGLIFIPSNLIVLVVTLIGCGIGVMIKHAFF